MEGVGGGGGYESVWGGVIGGGGYGCYGCYGGVVVMGACRQPLFELVEYVRQVFTQPVVGGDEHGQSILQRGYEGCGGCGVGVWGEGVGWGCGGHIGQGGCRGHMGQGRRGFYEGC